MSKPLTQRILEELSRNPGLSVRELSQLLGISLEKTRSILYRLKSSGFIEKTSRGYMLTERGLRFLEYLEQSRKTTFKDEYEKELVVEDQVKPVEEQYYTTPPGTQVTIKREEATRIYEVGIEDLKKRIESLEKRIEDLERTVRDLVKAVQARQKRTEGVVLEEPVMFYVDAVNKYSQAYVEKLLSDGRIRRIGALVVDLEFYREFKAKFPIRVQDADKLSHHERLLLDEMRKEAMVVLFAGREYRLVET